MSRRLAPSALLGPLSLLACLTLATPAWAADDHGHAAAEKPATEKPAADKPAPKAVAKAAGKGEAPAEGARKPSMSMDELRERLAERLGATKAPESRSGNVLRVTNKAEAPAEPMRRAMPRPEAVPTGHTVAEQLKPHAAHDIHWTYEGAGGPEQWGSLKPEFAACSSGQRQSPIDIREGLPLQLQPIDFEYQAGGFSVLDNGHTVQVNVPQGNAINVAGRRYELLQFHFHRPSEERVNGRQFDMVAHLVHKDLDGKLAVVAVLLDRGSAHPLIQSVWNALPLEKGQAEPAPTTIDLNQLLPKDRRYYTYMGSLTTPPCSEGVLWMVMKEPVPVSPQQIGIFARLYPMNARPIQRTAGRLIKDGQ